ncbi:hypothetical protein J6590_051965 [Homalodisca vitripennis]|nr:hypothetical protein J6590_051965 [Homalodisca vitripennis]
MFKTVTTLSLTSLLPHHDPNSAQSAARNCSFRPPLRHVQDSYCFIVDVTVASPRSELSSIRSYKLCICTVQSFRPPLRHVQDSYCFIVDVTVASPRSELSSIRSYKLCA